MSLLNKVNLIKSLEYESNVKHGLGFVGEDCLAGIFSSFTHSWLACGPQLFIINNSDGSLLCSWTFGEQSPEHFDITCAVELQMEGCSIPLLVVGISSENTNQICFFNPNTRKIIRTIDICYPVRTLCIIEDGLNEVNPINNALTNTQGLFAGGCADGSILLLDLCRGILLKALHADFGFISDEENPVETVVLDVNAISTSSVQQKLKESYMKQNNFAVLLKGSSDEGVTSLYYSFEAAILFVGTSSGSFVLWNMSSLDCIFKSQQTGRAVTSLSLLEPCDDPRHNLFLWICYEDYPQAVMYCVSFSSKYYVPGYGVYYQGFESAGLVYKLILGVDENLVAKKAINSQSVAKAVSKHISKNTNLPDGDSYQIRLFVTSYEVYNKGQISNRAVVFDLNQWYKEQMPDEGMSLCLDTVVLSGNTLWHLALEPSSVSYYQWVRPLEQHFHPSSLDFRVWCIEEEGINCFEKLGLQNQWLRNMSVVGPSALLTPTQLFHGALSAGLLPMFDEPPDPDNVTLEEERMYILTVCLENRAVSVIELCAREWSSGGHPVAGCTLAFLTAWLWSLHGSYKNHGNRMCVPLFDQSGLGFDVSERRALQHCKSLLCTVESLYTNIVRKYSTYVFVDGMEQKLIAMSLVRFYFDCCLKLISAKLLPEPNDSGLPKGSIIYKFEEIFTYVFMKRKEGPFLGDSLLGKTGGEMEWEEEGGTGRYPPPSIQSALRYCLHPAPSISNKLSLLLYLYMDILHANKPLREQTNFEEVKNFQYLLRIPDVQYKIVTSFWFLDHSLFDEGISLLLDPRVLPVDLTDDQHRSILSLLALQGQEKLGLQYLRLKAPALHEPNDIRLELELLLSNRLINEAFMFQRKHPELRESLLIQFFKGCIAKKLLGLVFGLHLDPKEEAVLLKFLKTSDLKEKGDLQVLLLLSRAKYTEAISLNERLNSTTNGPRSRLETATRDMIVRGVTGGLNTISRKLAYEMKQYRPPPPGTCPKPLSALIKIRNEPDGPLCQADSSTLLSAAASSIRHLSDFINSEGGKRKRSSSTHDEGMEIDLDDPPRKRIARCNGDNGIVKHLASSIGPSMTPLKTAAVRQEQEVMELVGTPLVKKRGKRFSPHSKPSSILKGKTPEKGLTFDDQGDTPRKTLRFTLPENEKRVVGRKSIHMRSSTLSTHAEKLSEDANVKKLREQLKSSGNSTLLEGGGIDWKDIAESSKPRILFSQGVNRTPVSQSKHTFLDITVSSAERKYLESPTREKELTLDTEAVFNATVPKSLYNPEEHDLDFENELEDINAKYLNKESVLDKYKRLRKNQIYGNNSEMNIEEVSCQTPPIEINAEEPPVRTEKNIEVEDGSENNVESPKHRLSFCFGATKTPTSQSKHTLLDITISSAEKKYLESTTREDEASPETVALFNTTIAKRLFTTDVHRHHEFPKKLEVINESNSNEESGSPQNRRSRRSQISGPKHQLIITPKVKPKEESSQSWKSSLEKEIQTEETEVEYKQSEKDTSSKTETSSESKNVVDNDENQDKDNEKPVKIIDLIPRLNNNETEFVNRKSSPQNEVEEEYSVHIESVLSLNASDLNFSNLSDEVTSSANEQVSDDNKEDDLEEGDKNDREELEEENYSSPEYDSDSLAEESNGDSSDDQGENEYYIRPRNKPNYGSRGARTFKAKTQEAVICLDSDSNDEKDDELGEESRLKDGDVSLDYEEEDNDNNEDDGEISDAEVFGISKDNEKSSNKSKRNKVDQSESNDEDVYNFTDDEVEDKGVVNSDDESIDNDEDKEIADKKKSSKRDENYESYESSDEGQGPNTDDEIVYLGSCDGSDEEDETAIESNESENLISGEEDEDDDSDHVLYEYDDEYEVGENDMVIRVDPNDGSFVPVKVASKYEQKCEKVERSSQENKDPLAGTSEEVSSTSKKVAEESGEVGECSGESGPSEQKDNLEEKPLLTVKNTDGKEVNIPVFCIPEETKKKLEKIKKLPLKEDGTPEKKANIPSILVDSDENNADLDTTNQVELDAKKDENSLGEECTESRVVSQEHSNDSMNQGISSSKILEEPTQKEASNENTIISQLANEEIYECKQEKLISESWSLVSSATNQDEVKTTESVINTLEFRSELNESCENSEINAEKINEIDFSKDIESSLGDKIIIDKNNQSSEPLKKSDEILKELVNASEGSQGSRDEKPQVIGISEIIYEDSDVVKTPQEETQFVKEDNTCEDGNNKDFMCKISTSGEKTDSEVEKNVTELRSETIKETLQENIVYNESFQQTVTTKTEYSEVMDSSKPTEAHSENIDSQKISIEDETMKNVTSFREKSLQQKMVDNESTLCESNVNNAITPLKQSVKSSGNDVHTLVSSSTDNAENNVRQSNENDKTSDFNVSHVQLTGTDSPKSEHTEEESAVVSNMLDEALEHPVDHSINSNTNEVIPIKSAQIKSDCSQTLSEIDKESLLDNEKPQTSEDTLSNTQKVTPASENDNLIITSSERSIQDLSNVQKVATPQPKSETNLQESSSEEYKVKILDVETGGSTFKDNEPSTVENKPKTEELKTIDSKELGVSSKPVSASENSCLVESVSCSAPIAKTVTLDKNTPLTIEKTRMEKEIVSSDQLSSTKPKVPDDLSGSEPEKVDSSSQILSCASEAITQKVPVSCTKSENSGIGKTILEHACLHEKSSAINAPDSTPTKSTAKFESASIDCRETKVSSQSSSAVPSAEHLETCATSETKLPCLPSRESISTTQANIISPPPSLDQQESPTSAETKVPSPQSFDQEESHTTVETKLPSSSPSLDQQESITTAETKTPSPSPSLEQQESHAIAEAKVLSVSLNTQQLENNATTQTKVPSPPPSLEQQESHAIAEAKVLSVSLNTQQLENNATTQTKVPSPPPSLEQQESHAIAEAKVLSVSLNTQQLENNATTQTKVPSPPPSLEQQESHAIPEAKVLSVSLNSQQLENNATTQRKVPSPPPSLDQQESHAIAEAKLPSPSASLDQQESPALAETKVPSPPPNAQQLETNNTTQTKVPIPHPSLDQQESHAETKHAAETKIPSPPSSAQQMVNNTTTETKTLRPPSCPEQAESQCSTESKVPSPSPSLGLQESHTTAETKVPSPLPKAQQLENNTTTKAQVPIPPPILDQQESHTMAETKLPIPSQNLDQPESCTTVEASVPSPLASIDQQGSQDVAEAKVSEESELLPKINEDTSREHQILSEALSEVNPPGYVKNTEISEPSGILGQVKENDEESPEISDNSKKNASEKTFFFGNNDSETFLRASKATFQVGSRASLPGEDESINLMEIAMIEEGDACEEDEDTDPRNTGMLDHDFSLHLSEDETIRNGTPKKVDKSMVTTDSYLSRKARRSSRISELGASKDGKSKTSGPAESSLQTKAHRRKSNLENSEGISKQKLKLDEGQMSSDKRSFSTQTSDSFCEPNVSSEETKAPISSQDKGAKLKSTEKKNADHDEDEESSNRARTSRVSTRTSEIKGILKNKGRMSSVSTECPKDLTIQGPETSNDNTSSKSEAEAIIRSRALKTHYKANVEDRDVRTDPYEIVENVQKNVNEKREKRQRRSSVNSLNSDDAKDLRIKQDDEESRRSRRLSKEPEIQGILKKPGESRRRSSRHSEVINQERERKEDEISKETSTASNKVVEKKASSRNSMEPELHGILKNKDTSSKRSYSSETSVELRKRLKEDFPEHQEGRRSRRYSEEPELHSILKRSETLQKRDRRSSHLSEEAQGLDSGYKEQIEKKKYRRHSVHDFQDVLTRESGRRKSCSSHTSDTATDLRIRLDRDFSEEKSRNRRRSEEPEVRGILKNKEENSRRRKSSQASEEFPCDLGLSTEEEFSRERRRSRRRSLDLEKIDTTDEKTVSGRRSRRLSQSSETSDIRTSCDDVSDSRKRSRKTLLLSRYKEEQDKMIEKSSVSSDQATDLRLRIEEDFPEDSGRTLKNYESKRQRRASFSSDGSSEKAVISKRHRHSLGVDLHREPRAKHTRSSFGSHSEAASSHYSEDDNSDVSSKKGQTREKTGRTATSVSREKRLSSKGLDLSTSADVKNIADLSAEQSPIRRKKSRSLQDFPIRRSTRLLHPILEDIKEEEEEETPRKKRRSLDDLDAANYKPKKSVSKKKDEPQVFPNLVVVESDSDLEDTPAMESVWSIEGYAKERRLTRNQKKVFLKNQQLAEATPSPSTSSPAKRQSRKKTPVSESPPRTPTRSSLRLQRMPPSESED